MSARLLPFALVLSSLVAAQGSRVDEALAPEVVASVDALLQSADDPRVEHGAIWRACCTEHGSVEPLIRHLAELARRDADPKLRDRTRRLLARIHRRAGQIARALRVLGQIKAEDSSVDDIIARAEMLDALGRDKDALDLYSALAKRNMDPPLDPALEKKIQLRRALMGEAGTSEGLAEFAWDKSKDRGLRNEAAIILALRGDQKTAIGTYVASGESTVRFRQEIRRAEWALDAKMFDEAQAAAWLAVENAKMQRDRKYALSVLASAYRRDDATNELLERLEKTENMSREMRELWVRLLREEGRADDALRLFGEAAAGSFDAPMRRQLLEICRETGRADVLVDSFARLIREEPDNLEWRSGLSRYFLEEGERQKAIDVWKDIESQQSKPKQLLEAAYSLESIGLEDVADRLARQASRDADYRERALMFVFQMHINNGKQDAALKVLRELDREGASSASRAKVADGYERLGRPDLAIATLERLREDLGGFLGTDLEMKLAIQLSRVNREAEALAIWRALWSRMRATPRGRFVEDRMMTVAARTGRLAKIAIELEDRLAQGKVDTEGVELLVRLYIKVGDPASATEIVEEFMKQSGGAKTAEAYRDVLQRKSKIYLACQDYYNYEQVIRELVEKDPENRIDHLRELAMSQLERGRLDLCVELLPTIREASGADIEIADEFEAGVYGLCGMKNDALRAYVKGMGRNPGRIDTYLLISNLMRETGREMEAARMFQYLAQTADRDDLFTIAIDGILNLRAQRGTRVPASIVQWALRTTLERLAGRSDRFYLYRLVTDLAADLGDMPLAIRTLKSGLPVAGERRTPIMREIMSKAQSMDPASRRMIGGQNIFKPSANWDATDYIMVGRRLLGQGDHVPPQTFMNLATVFIREGDVDAAMRTFNRAAEVLEYSEVLREAAGVLEGTGRPEQALQYYRRLLAVGADDPALVLKVASLEEQLGNTRRAFDFYHRGLQQVLARKPRYMSFEKKTQAPQPYVYIGANISVEDQVLPSFIDGMVVTASPDDVTRVAQSMRASIEEDLATVPDEPDAKAEQHALVNYPRLAARLGVWRSLVLSSGDFATADALDKRVLARFSEDRDVSVEILASRANRGLERSSRELLKRSPFRAEPGVKLAGGVVDDSETSLTVAAAARLVVPLLGKDSKEIGDVLERVESGGLTADDKAQLGNLFAACLVVDAPGLARRLARTGIREAGGRAASNPAATVQLRTFVSMVARSFPELARSLLRESFAAVARNRSSTFDIRSILFYTQMDDAVGGGSISSDAAKEVILQSGRTQDPNMRSVYFMQLLPFVDSSERAQLIRQVHDLVAPSQRAYLLVMSPGYLGDATVDDEYVEWFGRALKVALEAEGGGSIALNVRVGYAYVRGAIAKPASALVVKAVEVLDQFKVNPYNFASRVSALIDLDRVDEAFDVVMAQRGLFEATSIVPTSRAGPTPFRTMMQSLGSSTYPERVTDLLDRLAAAKPDSEPIRIARLDRLRRQEPTAYVAALEAEIERDPENAGFIERLCAAYELGGDLVKSLHLREKLVRLKPDVPRYREWLDRLQQRLLHPKVFDKARVAGPVSTDAGGRVTAPAGRGAGTAGRSARAAPRGSAGSRATPNRPGSSARPATPARSATAGRTATAGRAATSTSGRTATPSRATRAPASSAGRSTPTRATATSAAVPLVRLVSSSGAVIVSSTARGRVVNPQAGKIIELSKAGKQDEARRAFRASWRSFGLQDPRRSYGSFPNNLRPGFFQAYKGKLPFLAEELRAVLRVLAGRGDGRVRAEIFDILADDIATRGSMDAKIEEHTRNVLEGTASTDHVEILMRLLSRRNAPVPAELLEALVARTEPIDPDRLTRLVELYVKSGQQDRAIKLYRLAAFSRLAAQPGIAMPLSPNVLEKELRELFGDKGDAMLLDLLDAMGIDAQRGRLLSWATGLVSIWSRKLEPKAAAERMLALKAKLAELASPSAVILTPSGGVVAATLARAGRYADALAELELWLHTDRPPLDTRFRGRVLNPSGALQASLDASGVWQDRSAWLRALAPCVLGWHVAGKLRQPQPVLSAVARELWKDGAAEVAMWCIDAASAGSDRPVDRLARASALRSIDLDAEADEIEEALLRDDGLAVNRIAATVRRIIARDGAERGFDVGVRAATYTWSPDLLDLLATTAQDLGRSEDAKTWSERKQKVDASRAEAKAARDAGATR